MHSMVSINFLQWVNCFILGWLPDLQFCELHTNSALLDLQLCMNPAQWIPMQNVSVLNLLLRIKFCCCVLNLTIWVQYSHVTLLDRKVYIV